ncbi:MAG: sulfurtransferase [Rhodobiaceae bacterium]|nr:sulfurtransferase [Rhodobiaceae bacterium]
MDVIISAKDLRDALDRGDEGIVLVDTRTEDAWRESTIPGAVFLNVYDYFVAESSETGVETMAADGWKAMRDAGIDRAARVVFFEEETGMRSPRGLWFHELAGLAGGMILDGGLKAWNAIGGARAPGTGHPVEIDRAPSGETRPMPPGFRRDLVATTDELLDPATGVDILDTRRPTEFDGSFAHDCCARSGRIPGSLFLFYEDMLEDGLYIPPEDIRKRVLAAGLDPARKIITYCHRGARAATALYGLRMAGFDNVKVYTGSWHEWAGDPALPLETGAAD